MDKTSVIFVCQRIPYPPDKGDKITTWNVIKHFSKDYCLHLFCLTSETGWHEKSKVLERYCKTVNVFYKPAWVSYVDAFLSVFLTGGSISSAYYFSKTMKRQIEIFAKKEKAALAYVYSSNVFSHVRDLNIKKVFHLADVDSEKWKMLAKSAPFFIRPFYQIEFLRLRKWELGCAKISGLSIVCTEKEMRLFRSIGADGRIAIVKNGVDTEYFKRDNKIERGQALVFTGVMDYPPNVDAVLYFHKTVLPLVKKELSSVKFYIVGQSPARKIRMLHNMKSDCIVTGYVDDIRPFMNRSMVFVAPFRIAHGIQNKILEALSMELPVVTTSAISESLSLGSPEGIMVADDPAEMSKKIVRLLKDPEHCSRLGQLNRKAVAENYSWGKELRVLDEALDNMMKK